MYQFDVLANVLLDLTKLAFRYTTATQAYWKMMGIQSLERKSEWELTITYKITEDCLYSLLIVLEPKSNRVVDAEVSGFVYE